MPRARRSLPKLGTVARLASAHLTERRKFSIAELKRLMWMSIDDFVLTGTFRQQQWERLGRAVPPIMMSHVAAAVCDGKS